MTLADEQLEALVSAIEARAAEATAGPWHVSVSLGRPDEVRAYDVHGLRLGIATVASGIGDSTFLAYAREDVPELCKIARAHIELRRKLNTPQTTDFLESVRLEAIHQRERWGSEHDEGKAPQDWFWLIGYLAGKALWSAAHGDRDKALHHTISTAAVLLNWHAHMTGVDTAMRPGTAR